jgi:predicted nucleic acid-binding Zn ribbon protein
MNSLSQILGQVMKNLSLDKALLQAHIASVWTDAVGPSIARHTHPEQVRSDRLYVRVDSAPWLQELTMLKPVLVKKINEALGPKGRIDDLVLRIGGFGSDSAQSEDSRS